MTAQTPANPRAARLRCAVHPSRPAVGACPACGRLRCGADIAAVTTGCLGCAGERTAATAGVPPGRDLERLTRAALAAHGVALLGGVVASEYVGATVFAYLGPFVVGVLCGGAATRAARTDGRDRLGQRVRVLATVYAVLSVGLSFVIEGSMTPVSGSADVLLPYAAAVAGAVLWTMPPRRRAQGLATDV